MLPDPLPGIDCCRDCGAPFNDADAPRSGLCWACSSDQEPDDLREEADHEGA